MSALFGSTSLPQHFNKMLVSTYAFGSLFTVYATVTVYCMVAVYESSYGCVVGLHAVSKCHAVTGSITAVTVTTTRAINTYG